MSSDISSPSMDTKKTAVSQSPVTLLLRAIWLCLNGRAYQVRNLKSERLEEVDDTFVPFRRIVIHPTAGQPTRPGAIFRVRFRFKNLSNGANRLLSLIPIPLIVAQPGFRSKTWLLGERTGDFIGYYEFDTLEEANAYWYSLPLRMMRKRAAKGSLTHDTVINA